MNQYTFNKKRDPTNIYDNFDVTITFDAVTLEEMCQAFQDFLAGCAFQVQDMIVKIERVK